MKRKPAESPVLRALEGAAEAARIARGNTPLVIALSGGADSVSLLHAIVRVRAARGAKPPYGLVAGHLNHGIRGAEADADEAFCVDLCRSLGVPFVMGKADVPDEATKTGESLEMAARRLRRAFLAGAAVSAGASAVALAHTLDDQLELFLLRLARGAGLRGLAGMPAVAPFDRAGPGVRLAAEGPPWAPGDPARDLAGGPAPVARRRVARALYDAGADPESVSFAAVERVRALAAAGRNGTVPLGGSLRAKLDYGALSFDAANSRPAPGPAGTPFVFPALSDVPPCGATPDPERRLRVERSDKLERPPRGSFVGNPDPASVRAGALDGRRVVLRPWRAGDRIAVAGGRGTRKLSDIFTDAKLPRDFRARVVVLADAGTGEVLWLPGHGVSRELAVRPGDAILRLVLSRR